MDDREDNPLHTGFPRGIPKPDFRNPDFETRGPKPESRNPNPEPRILHPESRNPNPEVRNPNPESRNPNFEKKTKIEPLRPKPKPLTAGGARHIVKRAGAEGGAAGRNRAGTLIPLPSEEGTTSKLLRNFT